MAKLKPIITLQSYGIYSTWDNESKALPQIEQFITEVIATLDVEFGFDHKYKKSQRRKITLQHLSS